MVKFDDGHAPLFAESILHVVGNRARHEERAADLKQSGSLDRLHVPPEMSILAAKIAIPPSTWPCLNLHRHGFALRSFVMRPDLIEKGFKSEVEGRVDTNFLDDIQSQI